MVNPPAQQTIFTSALIRLYPKHWQARYGDEFAELLHCRPLRAADIADIIFAAAGEHAYVVCELAQRLSRCALKTAERIGTDVRRCRLAFSIACALAHPCLPQPTFGGTFHRQPTAVFG